MLSTITRVMLRMPNEMHAALQDLARRENRSLHAQILYMLRGALETKG